VGRSTPRDGLPNGGFRNAESPSFKPQFAHADPTAYAPVDALLKLADSAGADLIVVGSVGFNSVVGRLVGSVPRAIRSRAKTEVLVVNTK
jgi:hypothetical protein